MRLPPLSRFSISRFFHLAHPTQTAVQLLVKLKPLLVSQLRGVRLVVESGLLAKGLTDLGPLHCRLVCELLGTLDLLIASVHTACALGAGAIPANVRASIDGARGPGRLG